MAVETDTDRAVFLADFGETATWTHGAGPAVELLGIAEAGAFVVEGVDGPGVLNEEGTLLVRASDLPAGAASGDAVTFRAAEHTVKSIEPDGTDMAVVRLELTIEG